MSRSFLLVAAAAGLAFSLLQACSSTPDAEATAPVADAGPPEARSPVAVDASDDGDNGGPSGTYPAAHSPPRLLTKLPGPVLEHPVVIPVFFGDDPDRARTEALLAQLPGSDYWALLGEYGVKDITIGASVVITPVAPATFSLTGIDETVASLWTRGESPAPVPNGTQIYALFFPKQTTLLQVDGSEFCSAGGAYHDSKGTSFAYAITPHCSPSFDEFSLSATHELIEASTDPYPLVTPAWAGADPRHVGDRGEVGDLCDYGGSLGVLGGAPLFGATVERVFSNARALTGHDPCLPDQGLTYFGASPVLSDDITYDDFIIGKVPGKGLVVKVGETKTVTLELFSDRKTTAWNVRVVATDPTTFGASTSISATLDRSKGENGEKLHLTVTRHEESAGGDVVHIYSTGKREYWTDSMFVGQ